MKTEYKNAVVTKRKIQLVYLRLLADGKQPISITDIVRFAKINRGTFYLHFKTKQDLINNIHGELENKLKPIESGWRNYEIDRTPEMVIKQLNQIIMQDYDFFKLLVDASDDNDLMHLLSTTIFNLINNNFQVMKYIFDVNRFNVVCHYVVGGILAVYKQWFNKQTTCTLDELTNYMSLLIKNGIKGFIHYES